MSTVNLTDPIVALIALLHHASVGGPDNEGNVWIATGGEHGPSVPVNLGQVGSPAADAALLWRDNRP